MTQHIRDVQDNARQLYTREEVETAIDRLADQLEQFESDNPVFLCIVVGGIVVMGGLLTRIHYPLEADYIHATRYAGETTGGELVWKKEPCMPLKDRTVILIDDILDTGLTLKHVKEYCEQQGAKAVKTLVLVDKQDARDPEGLPKADFTGLNVDNHYVFGYGMDYKGYLRNAPGIFAVSE